MILKTFFEVGVWNMASSLIFFFSLFCVTSFIFHFRFESFGVNHDSSLYEQQDVEKSSTMKKSISLHVATERLGQLVDTFRRFLRDPSPWKKQPGCGTSETITAICLRNINPELGEKSERTREAIFSTAGLLYVPKSTKKRILGNMASVRAPQKLTALMSRNVNLRVQ